MTDLSIFNYDGASVRTILIDGEPWFVAADLCNVLSIQNVRPNLAKLDDDEKGVYSIDTLGGNQELAIVSEAGMYTLVLRSRKPEAQPFRKWVTNEVLPSIRKTGQYAIAATNLLPANYIEALKALVEAEEKKLLLEAENQQLLEENQELAEAVDELFEYSSLVRIAKFNNVSEKSFSWRKLKAASVQLGLEIKTVPCPRFETKKLYPHDAWRLAYPGVSLPETTTLRIYPPTQEH